MKKKGKKRRVGGVKTKSKKNHRTETPDSRLGEVPVIFQ